jgi:hypothetical protein
MDRIHALTSTDEFPVNFATQLSEARLVGVWKSDVKRPTGFARDELLALDEFDSVRHARAHSSVWREDYNGYRPHSSRGGLPPNTFTQRCADSAPFAARTPLHQHSDITPVTQHVLS